MRIQELEEALRQTEAILNNTSNPGAAAAASASAFIGKISNTIQQRRPSIMNLSAFSSSDTSSTTQPGDDEEVAGRNRTLSSATSAANAASTAASNLFRRLSVRATGNNENTENPADS